MDKDFEKQRATNIAGLAGSEEFRQQSEQWMEASAAYNYTYNFSWFGVPIIQFPTDIMMMQEIIWAVRPDAIIETGVARGGSICFYASILALLDLADERAGRTLDRSRGEATRQVVGVDIDIRSHTQEALDEFAFRDYVTLLEGSSINAATAEKVAALIGSNKKCVLVLDSNHTHDHVLSELRLYCNFLASGSVVIVFDTSIEFDAEEKWAGNRDWGPGNSPLSALREFMADNREFEYLSGYWEKLGITVCPFGIIQKK